MKFEILCLNEKAAEEMYDSLVDAMKTYNWKESIEIYTEMPDQRKPTEILHYIRVGAWKNDFNN